MDRGPAVQALLPDGPSHRGGPGPARGRGRQAGGGPAGTQPRRKGLLDFGALRTPSAPQRCARSLRAERLSGAQGPPGRPLPAWVPELEARGSGRHYGAPCHWVEGPGWSRRLPPPTPLPRPALRPGNPDPECPEAGWSGTGWARWGGSAGGFLRTTPPPLTPHSPISSEGVSQPLPLAAGLVLLCSSEGLGISRTGTGPHCPAPFRVWPGARPTLGDRGLRLQ